MQRLNRRTAHFVWNIYPLVLALIVFTLIPVSADAATYYVGKSGSDGNSCATAQSSTSTNRKQTIAAGISCLSPGDTLIIGAGTYSERINNTVPAGSSCSAQTTIRAENEPTVGSKGQITANVTLRPSSGSHVIINTHANVKVHGLEVDASFADGNPFSSYNGSVTFNCYTIEYNNIHGGNDITPGGSSGILGDMANSIIQYNEVHHNGNSGASSEHGIYTPGPSNFIQYNYIHDNEAYCLHIYPSANSNTIRNNRCETNGSRGIIISGNSNLFYNNISDRNGWGMEVVGDNNRVFNNTLYNNGSGSFCIWISGGTGNRLQNNTCYTNAQNSIQNNGSSSTIDSNLFANPSFVNASGGDFHLNSGSPAIGAATNLSGTFTTDYDVTPRPQTGAWDIGAFQYKGTTTTSTTISPPNNLRVTATK
jgi:Right handed beta helix region